jgi:hypothetical protein
VAALIGATRGWPGNFLDNKHCIIVTSANVDHSVGHIDLPKRSSLPL